MCEHICVWPYMSVYIYICIVIHRQAREEIVFPNSLENLWNSTAGSAFLLFKENLSKNAYVQSKTSQL